MSSSEDLIALAQQIGIQALIDREKDWRDKRIAELEAQLADVAMEPWRRAIADHWGDEILKAKTPDDAIRAAYFKGLTTQIEKFRETMSSAIESMRWDRDRLKKEWLGQNETASERKATP